MTTPKMTRKRKRNSPFVNVVAKAMGLSRSELYNQRKKRGLLGHFKNNAFVRSVSGGTRRRRH